MGPLGSGQSGGRLVLVLCRFVGRFVYILHATDSQNLAKIQQACQLKKAGITELVWEMLR